MHTCRLKLRPFKYRDLGDVFDLCSRAETSRYSLWEPHKNKWDSLGYLFFVKYKSGGIHWSVREKETNRMIGSCSFVAINWETLSGEIGYSINPDYWRQGFGLETAEALLDFGFGKLGLERIEVRVMEENVRSIALAEKLGMKSAGEGNEFVVYKGERRNIIRMEITSAEYIGKID